MDNLESITSEKSPTGFVESSVEKPVSYTDFIKTLTDRLPRDQADLLREGTAKQGNRNSKPTALLREFLFKEIENLSLTKEDDNNNRISNSKIKKSLQMQVDSIISVLDLSLTNNDTSFYFLGILLKSLEQKK